MARGRRQKHTLLSTSTRAQFLAAVGSVESCELEAHVSFQDGLGTTAAAYPLVDLNGCSRSECGQSGEYQGRSDLHGDSIKEENLGPLENTSVPFKA